MLWTTLLSLVSDLRYKLLSQLTSAVKRVLIKCIFCVDLGDPNQAIFFGSMGVVSALVFANLGAAYGTAKSGVGIVAVSVMNPDLLFRSIIPVVMAGVLGMYGLIIGILIRGTCKYSFSIRSFF